MDHLIVSLPIDEAGELAEIAGLDGASTLESRPFDGVVVAQVLVPLTMSSIPIVRTWVSQRYEHKKSQTVVLDGLRFEGYSANEIKELMNSLDMHAARLAAEPEVENG